MKRPQHAKPCPFCGADDLIITDWWADGGELSAIACRSCGAEAPEKTWNTRTWPASDITEPLPAILRRQAE